MAYRDIDARRRNDLARYHRRTAERRAAGLCLRCGKTEPAPERTLCEPCAEKCRAADRARSARLRAERKPRRDPEQAKRYERERGRRLPVNTGRKLTRLPPPELTRPVPSFLPGSLFPTVRPAGGVFGRRKDGREIGSRISATGRRGEVRAADRGGAAAGPCTGQDRPLPLAAGRFGAWPGRARIPRPHRRLRRWRGQRPGHPWPRLHAARGNQPAGRTAIASGDRQAASSGAAPGTLESNMPMPQEPPDAAKARSWAPATISRVSRGWQRMNGMRLDTG